MELRRDKTEVLQGRNVELEFVDYDERPRIRARINTTANEEHVLMKASMHTHGPRPKPTQTDFLAECNSNSKQSMEVMERN